VTIITKTPGGLLIDAVLYHQLDQNGVELFLALLTLVLWLSL
jgi:hypothetical protein